MLIDQHLIRLCEAILNDSIGNETFDNLIVEAGVKLDDKEWEFANRLINKSEEISHAVGGKDRRVVH